MVTPSGHFRTSTSMFSLAVTRVVAQISSRETIGLLGRGVSKRTPGITFSVDAKGHAGHTSTASRTRKAKEKRTPVDDTGEAITKDPTKSQSFLEEPYTAETRVALRPYQKEAINACVEALNSGKRRIGVSSPTGSGKTTMFMNLIPRIPPRNGGTQVLILVGSVELAHQAENAARALLPGYSVEVEQAKRVASAHADM